MIRFNATILRAGLAKQSFQRGTTSSTVSSVAPTVRANADVKIELPKKKQLDEVSILRALAGTVSFDPSGPRYWFIDDPFLIPRSRMQQRSFALSRASGRKAARYLLNKYDRKFGAFTQDEPRIDTLSPSPFLAVAQKADEEGLNALIELRNIDAAHRLYLRLIKKDVKLSMKTQLRLLDALSAFGSDLEAGERDYRLEPEERWYLRELTQSRSNSHSDRDPLRLLTQWQQDVPAEQLFARIIEQLNLVGIDQSTPEQADASSSESTGKPMELDADARQTLTCALQAVIRGAAKYANPSRVLQLLGTCQRYSIVPDLATYNAAIRVLVHSTFDNAQRIEVMMKQLKEMRANGVQPTLETFNAVLHVISSLRLASEQSRALASKTLREMQILGIKPSLATWTYVIKIFYPNSSARSTILYGIMERLEEEARHSGESFAVSEAADLDFFCVAMQRCVSNTYDPALAFRIDKLLHSNGNAALIGNGHNEVLYSSSMFRLLLTAETIDRAMEFYQQRVPHAWQPSRNVYHSLLDAVDVYKAYHYLPRIWDDLTTGMERGASEFEADLVRRILGFATLSKNSELQPTFVKWVEQLRNYIEFEKTRRTSDKLRGRMVERGNLDSEICSWAIVVALGANEYALARFFYLEYRELAAKKDPSAGTSTLKTEAYSALAALRKRLPQIEKQSDGASTAKNVRSLLDCITDPADLQALDRVERKQAVSGKQAQSSAKNWHAINANTSSNANATAQKTVTGNVKAAQRERPADF